MSRVRVTLGLAALAFLLGAMLARGGLAVLTDQSTATDNTFTTAASFGWLATGFYSGTGSDSRSITGVGFRPDIVFIKSDGGTPGVIRTSTMTGDAAKVVTLGGALLADEVQSLDADGFTVGTSNRVNSSGQTYYWVAMKAGTDVVVGSYTGDGSDNRSITGVGFQPVWVVTLGDGDESWFRPASVSGDASFRMDGGDQFTNRIQALEADGFQVGSHANINESGTTFHYIAWNGTSDAKQSTYTGNGMDNRSITGVGFQPLLVWTKRDTNNQSAWRPASTSGSLSLLWDGSGSVSNDIQDLETDGFQLGSNARVNSSGTYHYLALQDSP